MLYEHEQKEEAEERCHCKSHRGFCSRLSTAIKKRWIIYHMAICVFIAQVQFHSPTGLVCHRVSSATPDTVSIPEINGKAYIGIYWNGICLTVDVQYI